MFNLKLNNPELDQKSRIIYAGLFFFAGNDGSAVCRAVGVVHLVARSWIRE